MSLQRILVTGGAGFIGSHLTRRLLQAGHRVRVLDNLDPFYDPAIKRSNLAALQSAAGAECEFQEGDIRDPQACCTAVEGVDAVVHLAALAGVRPSIVEPTRYMDVNVTGTQVLLQALHQRAQSSASVPFVFGSSSSVYGGNEKVPFAEQDPVDRPISPYAASKRAGELAERLTRSLEQPYLIGKEKLVCSAAIGLALYPEHANTLTGLLRAADQAMYRAKARCRGGAVVDRNDLLEKAG